MKNIDLAMDFGGPSEPMSPKENHYPTFTYDGPEELGLPNSGTMTIRFKEVRRETSDRGGKKHYSCTIEVREIVSAKGEKDIRPAKTDKSAEDALDGHMKDMMKKKHMVEDKDEDYE